MSLNPIPLNLGVEDLLSEAVCKRLVTSSSQNFCLGTVFNRGGFGYLKRTVPGWNAASKSVPFLLLTDLDEAACPSALIASWLKGPMNPNLIFRVAMRETEAWLMGDKTNFASFLKVGTDKISDYPETLLDPKRELLLLAAGSRSADVRRRILPKPRSLAIQGPDYNGALIEYVEGTWDPLVASESCPSLKRFIFRLNSFVPTWT